MFQISKKKGLSNNAVPVWPVRVAGLLSLALSLGLAAPAWAEPRSVTLKNAVISDFSSPAPSAPTALKPAFKEKHFPLKDAENLKDVQAFLGPLTPDEKAFLEKNRFLLRPKPSFLPAGSDPDRPTDEMLAWFDALGGSSLRSERKAVNARLVTPDVFLHAWNKYMDSRLAAAERGPLLRTARSMLAGLYRNAAELRAEAGAGAGNWERLMAQLVVPLILLDEAVADEALGPQKALDLFEAYRADFSPAMVRSVRSELVRIYRAETRAVNALGLTPAAGGEVMDYGLFRPRGPYEGDALGRGYYRAMTWLSQLGWDARSESGLTDAINCTLAMSYERSPEPAVAAETGEGAKAEAKKPPAGKLDKPRQAWVRFMELSAFFFGYPESPGYLEWLPLLMKEAGVPEFTAATSSDPEVLQRLARSADALAAPARPYFKDWPSPSPPAARVLCLLPQRRSASALIAAGLLGREGAGEDLPLVSSALWLAVVLGHREAGEMLPRQVALTRPRASTPETPESDPLPRAVEALAGRLAKMSARLKSEPDPAWFANSETARLKLMATLADRRESGYPLYMRSPAFPVRQLEAMMGAYAELKHEAAYPAAPLEPPVPPSGEGLLDDREAAPLVKGLVEPNPEFWREMIRVADYTRSGFQKYGLFPEDLEDYGPLNRFLKRLERCAALSAKELAGEELNEDDYEFIRLFSLAWMAQPPGGAGAAGRPAEERSRSGLVSSIQELPPEIEGGLLVYEGTAEPWLMLVLVGNEKSPRLVLGLAYSHYEFVGPFEPRLTDAVWQLAAYARYRLAPGRGGPALPARNFWYELLKP